MIKLVNHSVDESSLLVGACTVARCIGGYRLAWVGLLQEGDPAYLRVLAQEGLGDDAVREIRLVPGESTHGGDMLADALATGQPRIGGLSSDPGVRPLLALPLRVDGALVGSLERKGVGEGKRGGGRV